MASDVFSEYVLVGGTALALQLGHRNSVDIDMFGNYPINVEPFEEELSKFGSFVLKTASKNIFICEINGIKVDFVNYQYPLIQEPFEVENVRMVSKKDIAAMKLNAIEGRGSRKDFIDLYFLLKEFTLEEMIHFYRMKYPNHTDFMMLQSLTYFNDAEQTPMPDVFLEFDWEHCKETIRKAYLKLNFI